MLLFCAKTIVKESRKFEEEEEEEEERKKEKHFGRLATFLFGTILDPSPHNSPGTITSSLVPRLFGGGGKKSLVSTVCACV